jgi:hypothetical protein
MKRIAFVVAAVLGTGCIVTDTTEVGSVNIYWDFLRTAPAQETGVIRYDDSDDVPGVIDAACDESRVEVVEVTSPLGTTAVYCVFDGVEGIGLDGIGEGVRSFRLRGWRAVGLNDYLVYDGAFDLEVRPNATTNHFVGIPGVSRPLDIYGGLYNTSTSQQYANCAAATPVGSASPPYFGYEIRDAYGSLVVNGTAGCAASLPAPVFAGDLELDNFTVRMRGYRVEDDALVFDSCDVPLDHFVAETGAGGFAPILRTNPIPTCP